MKEAEELLETGYPSRSLDASNRLIRRAQQDGVLMQDSRMWLSKARALTGHQQDSTLDIHYDKSTDGQRKEYANKVSKIFDFEKASNE